jgi:DNA-binding MarR family transcriptional regulator
MENQVPHTRTRETANRLHSIAIHLLRGLQDEDAASGLSRARLSALSVVAFAGPLRASRLAKLEGVRAPTMTQLVRGLEESGLIRRRPDPDDARASLLSATPDGLRLLREARERRLLAVERRLSALTQPERDLVEEAARILAGIYLPNGPPPLPDGPLSVEVHQGSPSESPRKRMKGAPR